MTDKGLSRRRFAQSLGIVVASFALAPRHSSYRGGTADWRPQGAFPLRGDLAKVLGMPNARVDVVHMPGAGCYGHNGADDVALDAALVDRAVAGAPVMLQWMRDDEFAWAPFGPGMAMRVEAGLASDGRIVDWSYDVWQARFQIVDVVTACRTKGSTSVVDEHPQANDLRRFPEFCVTTSGESP